jgi:SAM-dependent methyltransferase
MRRSGATRVTLCDENLMRAIASIRATTPFRYIDHPFDKRFGLDTSGYISKRDLVTGHPHDAYVTGYSAVAPSVFRQMCRRWMDTLAARSRVQAFSFIDVGAGKGRALLLASELPFRKIIGVELSDDLSRLASQNIEIWKARHALRTPIRVVHQDILDFRWPRTPLAVYLYNPFERELAEELIERLRWAAKAGSRCIDVLYVNPVFGYLLTRSGAFRELWSERITMSDEDQNADPYATSTDLVSAYRFTSP